MHDVRDFSLTGLVWSRGSVFIYSGFDPNRRDEY
jgi:hypothetical protein